MSLAATLPPRTLSRHRATPRAVPSVATRAGKQAPRLRYVVASLIGIFAILGGQLLLSIVLSDGAYRILSLERELAERERDLHVVTEDIGHMFDPQTVASLAVSLGMVTASDTAYVRLSDGSIVGESSPARAGSTTLVSLVPGAVAPADEVVTAMVQPSTEDTTGQVGALAALTTPSVEEEGIDRPATPVSSSPAPEPVLSEPGWGGTLPSPDTR